ncbi:E3 ubiquitin-protein ligase rnf168-like [Anopheles cruzii]|uniref:E3 ubiquitin-protein ligase rnf168-like n=1 Tax=Anopheles cruzii TaxID=68878 RepID=UPI0022EC7A1A|nr:E3 ubiquitin-protein ligase rnf168-like [Anopheles cruzii]
MSSKLLNYAAASSTTSAHSRFVNDTKRRATVVVPGDASSSAPWNYDNLQLSDILCPVCQSLAVEPVFLPCQHLFCRSCLRVTIETNNLNCPCCRKRFGTWYRNASRGNTLVHERLWQAIQSQFRERLHEEQKPASGPSDPNKQHAAYRLANPGDIRKEYKEELKRYQQELLSEEKKERIASEQYIINLYKQEGIIDLADSSSHVSVSSTTTPDVPDSAGGRKSITNSSVPGPSSASAGARQPPPSKAHTSGHTAADSGSEKVPQPVRLSRSKSPSNGSVISISSTSSAASAVTATSFVSSSAVSERFSLIKSVSQKIGRSAELVKQTASDLHRLTFGKLQQHQKSMGTLDLNRSELCVKPTELHKAEQRGAADEEDDTDSLKAEQNHFVPIHTTLPKSSFSLDNVVRVAPIRSPMVSVAGYTLTPKKCPYRPLAEVATTGSPRQSAFSVVNFILLTPPKKKLVSGESSEKSSTSSASSSSSSSSDGSKTAKKTVSSSTTARRGRRRRKLKFTPTKGRKITTRRSTAVVPQDGDAEVTTTTASSRSTVRRTSDRLPRLLKHAIVSDQQRLEQQIEMERRDFEFAQKLQQKLNRSNGVMQEIHRLYPAARNCSYSLRRKGGNVEAFDRGTTLRDDRSTEDTKNLAQKTRKRKATSSSVENDVPTASPPSSTGRAADAVRKRQTRRTIKQEPVEAPSPPVDKQLGSVPQRKSTRNKAR